MRSTAVDRLANGYFSRHPIRAMVLLLVGFGLAGGVAPAVELLLAERIAFEAMSASSFGASHA